jgi:transcriptional regulator
MYNFSYFKENDKQIILDLIEEYPFAFMTGSFSPGARGGNPSTGFIGSKKW